MVQEINGFQYDPLKCTNCLCCHLICSFNDTDRFNPLKAHISIDFKGPGSTVSFRDGCLKCGLCARYCPFGALVEKEGVN